MQKFAISVVGAVAATKQLKQVSMANFTEQIFENKIDHFGSNYLGRTYGQRYWTNDEFSDGKTVFLYLCGEWTCSPPDTHMYPFMVGAEENALLITLEHRYYGASQPFDNWSTSNLELLTSEQALADTAVFIDAMNESFMSEQGYKPEWIVIGGSYPGALSAWFKSQYPNHTLGAWSSSGVIVAKYDFWQFDQSLFDSASKSGVDCPAQVIEHYTWIEEQFSQNQNINEICAIFEIDPAQLNKKDFFWFLSDIYTTGIQYGDRTGLCSAITVVKDADMLTKLTAVAAYGKSKGIKYSGYDAVSLQNETIDINSNLRQWTYQFCTEFGFFQTPMNHIDGMRSQVLRLNYWPDYCERIFGSDLPANYADQTNAHYGGYDIQGTNIVFTNAAEDPWQWAGMRYIADPSSQTDLSAYYIDCPDCGHCIDFHTPTADQPEQLTFVQSSVAETIHGWLEAVRKPQQFLQ